MLCERCKARILTLARNAQSHAVREMQSTNPDAESATQRQPVKTSRLRRMCRPPCPLQTSWLRRICPPLRYLAGYPSPFSRLGKFCPPQKSLEFAASKVLSPSEIFRVHGLAGSVPPQRSSGLPLPPFLEFLDKYFC